MQLLDANVILRYLLNDHAEMSLKARDIISSGNTYTKPEVISEVIYVLEKVYHINKNGIRTAIHSLLDDISCNEKSCILCAIDIYTSVSLDFVDCLLIAYHRINNENIFSFDKKLNKHLD
ncbi:MAG: PIN domain-containing protein [Lachnospiraceae bacterium]